MIDDDAVGPAVDPNQRLSPQVARLIREMIVSGEAPGNTALRTEHLADRFGVSQTPVREALMSLSGAMAPAEALMVGDSPELDYAGALAAGLQARLLDRDARFAALNLPTIRTLRLPALHRGAIRAPPSAAFPWRVMTAPGRQQRFSSLP